MKRTFMIISMALLIMTVSFPFAQQTNFPAVTGPYFGQMPPKTRPEIFAPGIISTDLHDDFGPAFTPDGKEVFFRCVGNGKMIILHMQQNQDKWGTPDIASFSGKYNDLGVFISHDGKRLFFSSDRPTDENDRDNDLDIFTVDCRDGRWGEPHNLPVEKRGLKDLFACSTDSSGTIYLHARNADGMGGFDLYRLKKGDSLNWELQIIGSPICTKHDETSHCIARDGRFIVYFSDNGLTGKESAGLYVAFLSEDSSWSQPVNLSREMGMELPGKYPSLSPDGKYLFFIVPESAEANRRHGRQWELDVFNSAKPRHGGGNVYWVDTSVIEALRPN